MEIELGPYEHSSSKPAQKGRERLKKGLGKRTLEKAKEARREKLLAEGKRPVGRPRTKKPSPEPDPSLILNDPLDIPNLSNPQRKLPVAIIRSLGKAHRVKWHDPIAFEQTIEDYFEYCNTHIIEKQVPHSKGITLVRTKVPYTLAGLSRALGINWQTLSRYRVGDHPLAETEPEIAQRIADAIANAKDMIHEDNVNMALLGCHDPKVAELMLGNHFGYTRKIEMNLPSGGEINVTFVTDRTRDKIDAMERENIELKRRLNAIENPGLKLIENKIDNKLESKGVRNVS